ncbi:MAG: type II toxin-antitoxin system MqsA family antitoxin [Bacteroidota bacterium]|nr:type II toxin-antitoxin system MqsA family antitoxin [Bacteroidota bacterium]
MTCVICKTGLLEKSKVIVTLNKDGSVIIFKNVPADVYVNCGEYYLNEDVTEDILSRAKEAVKNKPEIEILQYAA